MHKSAVNNFIMRYVAEKLGKLCYMEIRLIFFPGKSFLHQLQHIGKIINFTLCKTTEFMDHSVIQPFALWSTMATHFHREGSGRLQ